VVNEDVVSVAGNAIAFLALALNQITGSSIPQGVAAVLIALVLIRISLRLIQRSHDFLVGAWVQAGKRPRGRDVAGITQPIPPAEEERVRAFVLGYPGVTGIRELLVTFLGPGRVWLVARAGIADDLRGVQVEELVRGIESGLKRESEFFYRVDVVPSGREEL
jgi:divalent metal cation (Fe/Co/Zn/Cd) transporter